MSDKSLALFPGTFDPITVGHVSLVHRALAVFETVLVAVAGDTPKESLFSLDERLALIREVFADESRVRVASYTGLTVDFAKRAGARAMIRGLRSVSDFDYEYKLAFMNRHIENTLETVFFMAESSSAFVSSSAVRELAALGVSVKDLVPECVRIKLEERFARNVPRDAFNPDQLVNAGRC